MQCLLRQECFPSVDISRVAIVVIEDIFVFIVMRLRYARTEGFRAEKKTCKVLMMIMFLSLVRCCVGYNRAGVVGSSMVLGSSPIQRLNI